MSDLRQMPLFTANPQSPDDINKHTPFVSTLELFLKHLQKEGKSEHTLKAFRSDLLLVGEHLDNNVPVGNFTTTMLNDFLKWLENGRGVPCSRKSYARRVTTLKVYFKWIHSIGAIIHDPAKAILQRSGPAPLSDVLSEDQILACIDFTQRLRKNDIQDYRPEMLFRLLVDTGIKKSETMRLTPASIDRTNPNRPLLVVRNKVRNVFKERRIELDKDWVKLFDLYRQQYPPKKADKPEIITCTSRNLEYILTDLGEGAGIPFKLSFEVLRWTSAVRDHQMGVEDDIIREKLGLSKISWHETGQKIRKLSEKLNEANI